MKSSARPGWPTFLDGAFDGAVLAFAAWTVFYQFALAYQFSMLWAAWPWMILAACSVVAGGAHALRRAQPDVEAGRSTVGSLHRAESFIGSLAIGALALLVLLVAGRERWGVWPVAITAIGLLVLQLVPWIKERLTDRADRTAPSAGSTSRPDAVGQGAHVIALGASLGFGVLGMFLLRPDADDTFYVNRATWVAEHGTAATNDTMFGPNNLPPSYSGGLLTPSIESLQGVVAHALHIQAASLCYLLAVPVLGTMAGWTTWRLVRAWATRRHVWVMVAAMAFLVASGDSVVGGYSLGRIWQGKATAYVILIPLVWLLLSRTVDRARRTELRHARRGGGSLRRSHDHVGAAGSRHHRSCTGRSGHPALAVLGARARWSSWPARWPTAWPRPSVRPPSAEEATTRSAIRRAPSPSRSASVP
ncbi:DUF6077 domain-containing protein [Aeromicrobium sp. UC242_57]|uniref:DUF6077 domain-containing protein n=1 Tax=Aeromicrobium sp. UC242_57 TaxID=3374624 RepID=UPI0037B29041